MIPAASTAFPWRVLPVSFGTMLLAGVCMLAIPCEYWLPAALACVFLTVAFLRFEWALAGLLMLLPVTRFPGLGDHIPLIRQLLSLSIFAVWTLGRGRSWPSRAWENPFNLFIIPFGCLILANLCYSTYPLLSAQEALAQATALLFFYLFFDMAADTTAVRRFASAMVVAAAGTACVAVLQTLIVQFNMFSRLQSWVLPLPLQDPLLEKGTGGFSITGFRSVGTFYHPNLLGIYLTLVIPFAAALGLSERRPAGRVYWLLCAVMLAGLLLTGSRGAYIGCLLSAAVFLFALRRRLNGLLVCAVSVVAAAAGYFLLPFIRSLMRIEEGISFRDIIWQNALSLANEHPFLGLGLGTFSTHYSSRFGFASLSDYREFMINFRATGSVDFLGLHAHNVFLNYAAEMGVAAAVLIAVFYGIVFIRGAGIMRAAGRGPDRKGIFAVAALAALTGNFVNGFFESYTHINFPTMALTLACVAGIAGRAFITAGEGAGRA